MGLSLTRVTALCPSVKNVAADLVGPEQVPVSSFRDLGMYIVTRALSFLCSKKIKVQVSVFPNGRLTGGHFR